MNILIFSKDRPMQLEALIFSIRKNMGNHPIWVITPGGEGYEQIDADLVIEKSGFKKTFESALNGSPTCLFVDDVIVFKKVPKIKPLDRLQVHSLRLGDNVKKDIHFTYPFSMDGHIYNTSELYDLVKGLEYSNPNDLEVKLQRFKSSFSTRYEEQYCVSIPHNKVSDSSGCYHMGGSAAELLEMFKNGYRIDIDSMDFSGIRNVHKNIDYAYKLERDCR